MRYDQFELNFDISEHPGIDRHRIVIAYDTPDHSRRRKMAKMAVSYATRVQKSVYEAMLTDAQLRILAGGMARIADAEEDDIRLYPQCARCMELRKLIGKAMPPASPILIVA